MLKTRSGLPKHCTWQSDRTGKKGVRFRRRGVSVYLTGIPWSEPFMRQYGEALTVEQNVRAQVGANLRTLPGSISALCVAYYSSPEFLGLKASTQRVRRNMLERFRAEYGHGQVKDLQIGHLRIIIGEKASTPAAANNLLKVLRVVLNYAVGEGLTAGNPALAVKRYKQRGEGIHAWSEAECVQFEARHPIGSKARLALELLLGTGQRRGDVRTNMTFLTTEFGKPFTPAGFGNWFRDRCNEANLPQCSAHGLRKLAATRLANAGCSSEQIKAITGHRSDSALAPYIRKADKTRLARRARELVRAERERNLPNPETHVYPTAKKL